LIGVGAVPIDDVDWGVEELERIAGKGLRGVMIATRPPEGARPYRDRIYDRFWAAAEALAIPLTLHIVTGRVRDPFTYHGEAERGEVPASFIELFNEAGPVLASDFVFGGIFDRFPRLRIVLSEYDASWLPILAYRLERIESFPGLPRLAKPARAYLKENVWAGIIKDPLAARLRYDIGVDRITWGSDFPHPPCTYPRTQEVLDRILADVPAGERHQIVAGNVMRLYDIAL
jgi:predicted TIM-barrel fold metal-dependent hydrolase